MNILVIEDNEYKFKQIEESLNRLLKNPNIIWMKSRNSGLFSFINENKKKQLNPYHMVISDNYLPFYSVDDNNMFEKDAEVQPFAADIVSEIRRLGFEELPIIVCSSEEIKECDYNYFIKYDSSVSLDETLKTIFSDFNSYMAINNLSLESIVVSKNNSKLVIHDTGYLKEKINFCEIKKSDNHDKLVEEVNARIEEGRRKEAKAWHNDQNYIINYNEEGPVKKLVPNNKK